MTFGDPVRYPDGAPVDPLNPVTWVRWCSAGGQWWLQIDPMLFGLRLHLLRPVQRGDRQEIHGYELSYCLGTNQMATLVVPRVVMLILQQFDESVGLDVIHRTFPEQRTKPMHNDPDCWRALCALAGIPEATELLGEMDPEVRWQVDQDTNSTPAAKAGQPQKGTETDGQEEPS